MIITQNLRRQCVNDLDPDVFVDNLKRHFAGRHMKKFAVLRPEAGEPSGYSMLTANGMVFVWLMGQRTIVQIREPSIHLTLMTCSTPVTDGVMRLCSGCPIGFTVPRMIAYGTFWFFCAATCWLRLSSTANCGASCAVSECFGTLQRKSKATPPPMIKHTFHVNVQCHFTAE